MYKTFFTEATEILPKLIYIKKLSCKKNIHLHSNYGLHSDRGLKVGQEYNFSLNF